MHYKRLILGDLETNCYLVWANNGEGIVIDPADDAEQILAVVESEKVTVKTVILTHVHFDHMLAAEAVSIKTNAPIMVGAGDADALNDTNRNLSGWFSPGKEVTVEIATLLHEGDTICFGDESFIVMETPGHTPGCICLYNNGVLFSGDTLFRSSIGRLDFPGGDTEAMVESLERLLQLPDDTAVYSGHGPATTIGTEKKYNPYLR